MIEVRVFRDKRIVALATIDGNNVIGRLFLNITRREPSMTLEEFVEERAGSAGNLQTLTQYGTGFEVWKRLD